MTALLPIREVEKPWGVDTLPAPFVSAEGSRIGEIWFEPPPALPELLIKYIFTSEALSVQVHPSDAQTQAKGLGHQGKEECWYVIAAEPGAKLGIGFDAEVDAETLRAAALDGSIEDMMTWHEVAPGDFFYIPANTVHAIGAGVGLIETQQNSDITYRLYDYGRPRELHLDDGVAVARAEPYPDACHRHVPETGEVTLVNGPLFRLDRLDGPASPQVAQAYAGGPLLVVPRSGQVQVAGAPVAPGQCALADSFAEVTLTPGSQALVARPLASR